MTCDNEAASKIQLTVWSISGLCLAASMQVFGWTVYFAGLCTHACWHAVFWDRDCVTDLKNNFK